LRSIQQYIKHTVPLFGIMGELFTFTFPSRALTSATGSYTTIVIGEGRVDAYHDGKKPKLPLHLRTAGLRTCKGKLGWDPDSGSAYNRVLAVGNPIYLAPDAIGHVGTMGPIMMPQGSRWLYALSAGHINPDGKYTFTIRKHAEFDGGAELERTTRSERQEGRHSMSPGRPGWDHQRPEWYVTTIILAPEQWAISGHHHRPRRRKKGFGPGRQCGKFIFSLPGGFK
jgi:hypothetical protein